MKKVIGMVLGLVVLVVGSAWAADSDADLAYKKKHAIAKALENGTDVKAQAYESMAVGEGHTQTEQNGDVSEEASYVEAWCWQNAGYQWFLVGDFEKAVTDYEKALKCAHIAPRCKVLAEKDLATAKEKLAKEPKPESK